MWYSRRTPARSLAAEDADLASRALALARERANAPRRELPNGIVLPAHLDTSSRVGPRYRAMRWRALLGEITRLAVHGAKGRRDGLDGYRDLHPLREPPRYALGVLSDASVGQQRLCGPNPMDLRPAGAEDAELEVPDAVLARALGPGWSLAAAIGEGRAFVEDHRRWAPLAREVDRRASGRWMAAPRAVFVERDGGLLPVAVQLRPWEGPAVFTPDQPGWRAALLFLQVAHGLSFQLRHHLGSTHLPLSAVALAARRELPARHPLSDVLRPHLRGVHAVVEVGHHLMLGPGGALDQLVAPRADEVLDLAAAAMRGFRIADVDPTTAFAGLERLDLPMRDLGAPVWRAVLAFAEEAVAIAWPDGRWAADPELMRFLDALARDLPALERPTHGRGLARLLAGLIYASGPRHSAMNAAQWEVLGCPANMPLAAWAPAPRPQEAPLHLERYAPPAPQAIKQVFFVRSLCFGQTSRLGHHPAGAFADARMRAAAARFRRALDRIEVRDERFPWLEPARCANGADT